MEILQLFFMRVSNFLQYAHADACAMWSVHEAVKPLAWTTENSFVEMKVKNIQKVAISSNLNFYSLIFSTQVNSGDEVIPVLEVWRRWRC